MDPRATACRPASDSRPVDGQGRDHTRDRRARRIGGPRPDL